MYNVTVYNNSRGCLVNYDVTNTTNVRNWYTAPGYIMYDTEKKSYETEREEYVITKAEYKPSLYKRDTIFAPKNRYDYAFTEKQTKTVTTEKDVYYNSHKKKFITSIPKVHTKTRTEYNIPSIIIF